MLPLNVTGRMVQAVIFCTISKLDIFQKPETSSYSSYTLCCISSWNFMQLHFILGFKYSLKAHPHLNFSLRYILLFPNIL